MTKLLDVSGTEAAVCEDIARRQAHGLKKYGVSVRNSTLTLRQWLQHAYEEHLDAAVYLKRAMEELDDLPRRNAVVQGIPIPSQTPRELGEALRALGHLGVTMQDLADGLQRYGQLLAPVHGVHVGGTGE